MIKPHVIGFHELRRASVITWRSRWDLLVYYL